MRKPSFKSSLSRAAALVFFALSLFVTLIPNHVWAQAAGGGVDTFDDAACRDNVQQQLNAEAQATLAAAYNAEGPVINVRDMYCLSLYDTAFQLLISIGDPLSVIVSIVINQIIIPLLNQVCAAVLNTVNEVLSKLTIAFQLCLPFPNFSSGSLNNYGLQQKPCNGVALTPPIGIVAPQIRAGGGSGSGGGGSIDPWAPWTIWQQNR